MISQADVRAEYQRRQVSAEQARRRIRRAIESDSWQEWHHAMFPHGKPLAEHHGEFWAWLWSIEADTAPPRDFVGIWARGGGKSTNVERGIVAVGARQTRRYVLYVCETQAQADKHVQSISDLLGRPAIALAYPDLARRAIGKYGASLGWRRNRLRTASGLTIDAIGLDSALRGAKVDEDRPDLIVLDDIDGKFDSPAATLKKTEIITTGILPSGAPHAVVLAVQNLITDNSIFSQLADNRAEWLLQRRVSGPHPALREFEYETYTNEDGRIQYRITRGQATWAGQSVEDCQRFINKWGISAFIHECQHDVEPPAGGMFDHLSYQRIEPEKVPDLDRVVVWCDPAVTSTDDSDSNGVQVDGQRGQDIYRLHSWEQRSTPLDTLSRAIQLAVEYGAVHIGVETDQGGDTWKSVYNEAWQHCITNGMIPADSVRPKFKSAKAGSTGQSKAARASRMLTDYERGRIWHVLGTHLILEKALRRFPKTKPYDLVDAAFWGWLDLSKPKKEAKDYSGWGDDGD